MSYNNIDPAEAFTSEAMGIYFPQVRDLSHTSESHTEYWNDLVSNNPINRHIIPSCFFINNNEFSSDDNDRRKAQSGAFTFHLGYKEGSDYCIAPKNLEAVQYAFQHVGRVIIPSYLKKEIIANLKKTGKDSSSIFPGEYAYSEIEYAYL